MLLVDGSLSVTSTGMLRYVLPTTQAAPSRAWREPDCAICRSLMLESSGPAQITLTDPSSNPLLLNVSGYAPMTGGGTALSTYNVEVTGAAPQSGGQQA